MRWGTDKNTRYFEYPSRITKNKLQFFVDQIRRTVVVYWHAGHCELMREAPDIECYMYICHWWKFVHFNTIHQKQFELFSLNGDKTA